MNLVAWPYKQPNMAFWVLFHKLPSGHNKLENESSRNNSKGQRDDGGPWRAELQGLRTRKKNYACKPFPGLTASYTHGLDTGLCRDLGIACVKAGSSQPTLWTRGKWLRDNHWKVTTWKLLYICVYIHTHTQWRYIQIYIYIYTYIYLLGRKIIWKRLNARYVRIILTEL